MSLLLIFIRNSSKRPSSVISGQTLKSKMRILRKNSKKVGKMR